MSQRPYAAVFYGLCLDRPDLADEDAVIERYARSLRFAEPPPERYGDGTPLDAVTNAIDAQMKRKLHGMAPDHQAWWERARAEYAKLGVSVEAHGEGCRIFVTGSDSIAGVGDSCRLDRTERPWPDGRGLLSRYCQALAIPFDEAGVGWWLTVDQ